MAGTQKHSQHYGALPLLTEVSMHYKNDQLFICLTHTSYDLNKKPQNKVISAKVTLHLYVSMIFLNMSCQFNRLDKKKMKENRRC